MTEIQSLFKLQELDMECLALETALRELPVQKEIDESQERLSMLRERLSRLGLELNRVRKEQKHEEWEIKDITATASSISRKLYGGEVTNPREIENMRYRLDTLEATKSRLEDDVIALMEQAEALESEISEVNLEITQKEAELVELTGIVYKLSTALHLPIPEPRLPCHISSAWSQGLLRQVKPLLLHRRLLLAGSPYLGA
jgi:predicted  nucleic acid-binding Zn-ribbon protein